MIELKQYNNEEEKLKIMIKQFWFNHNNYNQSDKEALEDLKKMIGKGQKVYFIIYNNLKVGFIHLGSRGADIDWLETIFVLPEYQNKGIGTKAIKLIEEVVKKYSISLYIEVAARNESH